MKLHSHYAVIITLTGIVSNIIIWDGVAKYSSASGTELIQSDVAQIGDEYNGTNFLYNEEVFNSQTNSYTNEVGVR